MSQGLSLGHVLNGARTCPEGGRAQLGSVTVRRSPSSATSPPSARHEPDRDGGAEVLGRLAEDDRRRVRRHRLDRDARAVDRGGDVDAAGVGRLRGRARRASARPAPDRPGRSSRFRSVFGPERERSDSPARPGRSGRLRSWQRARAGRAGARARRRTSRSGRDSGQPFLIVELVHLQHRLREALPRSRAVSAGRDTRARRGGRSRRPRRC